MKFLIPPPLVRPPPPDLSYINRSYRSVRRREDRDDNLSGDFLLAVLQKHSGAPIPFEESQILEYYKKFLAQYSDYEDEDSEEDSDEEDSEEGEKGKKNVC
uniref:Uncharacterized protein n=1 Tax=Oryza sativa subsp. japonica TaxID=39947 RepID=Q2R364_ORYSJ|nr:hypothetical protein LOC_Os11g32990 [Oryza sativa Japonica Group]